MRSIRPRLELVAPGEDRSVAECVLSSLELIAK